MADAKEIACIVTRLALRSFEAGMMPRCAKQKEILDETYALSVIITKLIQKVPLDEDETAIYAVANKPSGVKVSPPPETR